MSETLLRQWELLRAIPRAPRKIDVTSLLSLLDSAGYRTTKRTLQRDLNALSAVFPLLSDTRGPAFGWSWSAEAPVFDLPAMDAPTALSVRMIEQFIPMLLPPILKELLAPQFEQARAVLQGIPGNSLSHWADAVRVVPREMPLRPPRVDGEVVKAVYDALLTGRRFSAIYRSRGGEAEESKPYEVNPLGLVARGNLLYLVCTLWNYQDIRQLALHRIVSVVLLETPVSRPLGFDLDRYIEQGEFQYPVGRSIRLRARCTRDAAAHLQDTPLSEDQSIEAVDASHVMLTATLLDSQQLEWWLLGLIPDIEVLEPTALRNRIKERVSEATRQYAVQLADIRE